MINKNIFKSARHTSSYLSSGPVDGPLVMFFHGWPELSYSWRHQLKYFNEIVNSDINNHLILYKILFWKINLLFILNSFILLV